MHERRKSIDEMGDEEIADIDPVAFWAWVKARLAELGKDVAWLRSEIEANKKTVDRWAKGRNRPRWGNVREVIAKLNGARQSGQPELSEGDLLASLPQPTRAPTGARTQPDENAKRKTEARRREEPSARARHGPNLRDFDTYLREIETAVAARLLRMPAVTVALAREIGVDVARGDAAHVVTDALLRRMSGKAAVMALNTVNEALLHDPTRAQDRRALKEMMLDLLPVATDWLTYVHDGRAKLQAGAPFVDLPLGTLTMAEAVIAGIDCRPCRFVADGAMGPAGGALVKMPVIAGSFVDPGEKKVRFIEAVVGLFAINLLNLSPDDRKLQQHERMRRRVDEALKFRIEVPGDDYLPRWLLLDDEILACFGARCESTHDVRIDEAVAILGSDLPHLRIAQLGDDLPEEFNLALHIGSLWRKPT